MTFTELVAWYLKLPEVKRLRSYAALCRRLERLEAHFGQMTLEQIGPEDVQDFITQRFNQVKPGTINQALGTLRTLFNKTRSHGKMSRNPLDRVQKLRGGDVARDRVLTNEEWAAYYEASPEWFKPVALCAYTTAMRRMEILKLRWSRVDLRAGFIRLRPEDTKTSEGRPIPIDPRLREMLTALPSPAWDDALVFTRNGQPIPDVRHGHQAAIRATRVRDFRFHDFRHCAITNWRRKGIDFLTIMKATGHRSLANFQRYNTVTEADLRALVG